MMKAVIFDFDGVMTTKALEITVRQIQQLLGERGMKFEPRDFYVLEGAGIREIMAELIGRPVDDPGVEEVNRKNLEMFRRDTKGIKAEQAPVRILRKLKDRRIKLAIASGAKKEHIEQVMGKDFALFDAVISEEDVKKTKPDPEPYLVAAHRLGVAPGECIVVENAPRGITAAKRAGMKCIAITTTLPAEDLAEADVVVGNYEELEKAIYKMTR